MAERLAHDYAAKLQGGALLAAHVAVAAAAAGTQPDEAFRAVAYADFLRQFNGTLPPLASAREVFWAPLVPAGAPAAAFRAFAAAEVPRFPGADADAQAAAALGQWRYDDASGEPAPVDASQPRYFPVLHLAPLPPAQRVLLLDLLSVAAVAPALEALLAQRAPQLTQLATLPVAGITQATSLLLTPVFAGGASGGASSGDAVIGVSGLAFTWQDMVFGSPGARPGTTRYSAVAARVRAPGGAALCLALQPGGEVTERPEAEAEGGCGGGRYDDMRHDAPNDDGAYGAGWAVSVWPTAAMHDHYVTETPMQEAITVAMVVLGVILVFVAYDHVARSRTTLLARMWQATEAVVADVFPHSVKRRLVEAQLARVEGERTRSSVIGTSSLDDSYHGGARPSSAGLTADDAGAAGGAAGRTGSATGASSAVGAGLIADAYPAATVIFADIVGFTEWSASVPPDRVFTVLEAVFNEFDALAKGLGCASKQAAAALRWPWPARPRACVPDAAACLRAAVAKGVQGGDDRWCAAAACVHVASACAALTHCGSCARADCYMACCGCPDAYEDHALRAADFAVGLGDAFARAGAATGVTHLCCRVGLHSGPVVAGVLRAEKHRFQLFGDTVNTASRMESTGEARRVQCSGSTAALLGQSGRHTLRRRGVIAVKGKGSVETFWLSGRNPARARGGSYRGSRPADGRAPSAAADDSGSEMSQRGGRAGAAGLPPPPRTPGDDDVCVTIDVDDGVTLDTSPPAAERTPAPPPAPVGSPSVLSPPSTGRTRREQLLAEMQTPPPPRDEEDGD